MPPRPNVRRLDAFRPDLLALQASAPERHPFLLESATTGGPRARWDLLAFCVGERLELRADGTLAGVTGSAAGADAGGGFLAALDRWFGAERSRAGARGPAPETTASDAGAQAVRTTPHDAAPPDAELPFVGGWFLYLGYELAGEIEPRLRLPPSRGTIAYAARAPAAALYDHATGATWLVAETGGDRELDAMERLVRAHPWRDTPPASVTALRLDEDAPERYIGAVRAALEHVAAGDIYQANLARAWRGRLPPGVAPADLYARLRRANPGPFAGLAYLPHAAVLSTSPERLVESRGGVVSTRPIAGTRPRIGDDAAIVAELRANAKERAEHVMLLDLERNDLGRICEPGTVVVDELMTIESYAHVHHIVSNVRGRRREDVTPGGVIRALFPGGTITGCPKVRCMEIVGALEGAPRGAYTGSLGYLSMDGSLDLNILIRTATVAAGEIEIRAGAGIVADSDPSRELDETRAKARGLLRGLGGDTT